MLCKPLLWIGSGLSEFSENLEEQFEDAGFFFKNMNEVKIDKLKKERPDLLIFDPLVCENKVIELCKEVKSSPLLHKIPIIVIYNNYKAKFAEKLHEMQVQDYFSKSYSGYNLVLQAKNLTRNKKLNCAKQSKDEKRTEICYKSITLDTQSFSVKAYGKWMNLTQTEFKLLKTFIESPNKALNRHYLLQNIASGGEYKPKSKSVDVLVVSLRKKIPQLHNDLQTVWGVGYRMV